MSVALRLLCLSLAVLFSGCAFAAPHVGYIYPAGGARGTTVTVAIGGQRLKDVDAVVVEGGGVTARVLEHVPPLQAGEKKIFQQVRGIFWAAPATSSTTGLPAASVPRRGHPLIESLRALSRPELEHVIEKVRDPRKRQPMQTIAETLLVELAIAADAAPGRREMRALNAAGLSEPLAFEVGTLREVSEREPNDPDWKVPRALEPPATLNGQLLPGDVDCFPFRARRGQRLRVDVRARRLMPFLADAVPGWFQALATIADATGRELASSDGTAVEPDPSMVFEAPADGTYTLTIRDALYRGRFDFVYRVTVEDAPPPERAPPPAVEPREVALPAEIPGCIAAPGEVDTYRFQGRRGDRVVADVVARRASSPLDALVELRDSTGRVIDWNDDYQRLNVGLLTHHADPHLEVALPADGAYTLALRDAQGHGGAAFTYRLRLSPPRPDFAVYVVPAAIDVPPGPAVPVRFLIDRSDGHQGDVEVAMVDAPPAWRLAGARILAGAPGVRATLTLPPGRLDAPRTVRFTASCGGVTHDVIPADEVMQGFIYRHVLPVASVRVAGRGPAPATRFVRVAPEVLKLAAGGTARAIVRVPTSAPAFREVRFELLDPPKGVSLTKVTTHAAGVELELRAGESAAAARDNLIVQVMRGRFPMGCLPAIPIEVTSRPSGSPGTSPSPARARAAP